MGKYVFTYKAVADLTSIWEYSYEAWSESQADKYYLLLINGLDAISRQPNKGRSYDSIKFGLKGFRIAKHIIFYLISESRIEIVRILHEQMDIKEQLGD